MEINTSNVDGVRIVELTGVLDTTSARRVQATIVPFVEKGGRMMLDVTMVDYMSSAGLRFLLSLHRQTTRQSAELVLIGVGEEIRDTMDVTGFLEFFTIRDTRDEGIAWLEENR